jgi:hypothetical protein
MLYYSKSKKEFVDIKDMPVSYRTNAALKCFRSTLLNLVNTKLHYSYLSNNSINELAWEDVEQYLTPLAQFIEEQYPELMDDNLKAFIEYINKVPVA